MNRRQFTAALAAVFSAPALPAFAAGTSAQAAQIKTATIIARSHNACSPAMLARLMRLDEGAATALHNTLMRSGVITASPTGLAMATNPTNTHCVPRAAWRPSNLLQQIADLKARAAEFLEDEDDTYPQEGETG